MSREFTNKLNDLIAEGVLDPGYVLECALRWMSEADVAEMCTQGDLANTGLFDEEEEEDEFVLVFGKRRRRINLSLAL